MALKFLNKKGWHTGSLRNIENVWKAEQKHDAEQRKLEELRKQIQEEREKSEFRQLQEQAGLVPRQERLDFLYESGLAVGKGNSDGFKALQAPATSAPAAVPATGESSSSKAAAPGALFEDKPQSANDAWRKLHSDPLLLIRQREQESLARIKNNPIKMAMIKKSVEAIKKSKESKREKKRSKKHRRDKSKNEKYYEDKSDSEDSDSHEQKRNRREDLKSKSKHKKNSSSSRSDSEYSSHDERDKRRDPRIKNEKRRARALSDSEGSEDERKRHHHRAGRQDDYSRHEKHTSRIPSYSMDISGEGKSKRRTEDSSTHLELKHKNSTVGRPESEYDSHSEKEKGRKEHLKYGRGEDARRKDEKSQSRSLLDSEDRSNDNRERRKRHNKSEEHDDYTRHEKHASRAPSYSMDVNGETNKRTDHASSKHLEHKHPSRSVHEEDRRRNEHFASQGENNRENYQPKYNRGKGVPKMTEEERAARLREMQLDAELHEDQRWKRLKKAADADSQEAARANFSKGKNFLDDAQKSIFGTEKGGSTTIEESVRRRAFYSQGSSAAHDSNAFRR